MATTLREVLRYGLGATKKPKFHIFDLNRNAVTLSSGTWSLRRRRGDVQVDSGNLTINNADTDPNGNTVKTVGMTIDLGATDIDAGEHWLRWRVRDNNDEDHDFRVLVKVEDYD